MLLLSIFSTCSARFTLRIDDFSRFEMAPTPLVTLVSTCWHPAKKTHPFYIPIWEEAIAVRTISQSYDPRIYVAVFLQRFYDFLRSEVICRHIGVSIMTEVNCQYLEDVLPVAVVVSGKLLRCGPLLFSVNNDRSSVSVRTTHEKWVLFELFKTANVDVCWDVRP